MFFLFSPIQFLLFSTPVQYLWVVIKSFYFKFTEYFIISSMNKKENLLMHSSYGLNLFLHYSIRHWFSPNSWRLCSKVLKWLQFNNNYTWWNSRVKLKLPSNLIVKSFFTLISSLFISPNFITAAAKSILVLVKFNFTLLSSPLVVFNSSAVAAIFS